MRTLLGILFLFVFVSVLPAQDFEGMGYVKAGGELLGPVKVKQNVGGAISIGEWPKTTFFVFDEYTAVLDENRSLLFEGGLSASGTPGEKFLAAKEKLLNANFAEAQQEQVEEVVDTPTEDSPKPDKKAARKKKKKEKPVADTNDQSTDQVEIPDMISTQAIPRAEDTSDYLYDGLNRDPRFGFGPVIVNYQIGSAGSLGYGVSLNRSYPIARKFRIGASVDAVVFHDFIFKKTMSQVYYDDMGYPVGEETYKFPEGFSGALQARPFAAYDFGCVRAGYQPVVALNYHSIWGTNVEVYPVGLGVEFLNGPVQVAVFGATKLKNTMYYPRMSIFGASVTFGNRSARKE